MEAREDDLRKVEMVSKEKEKEKEQEMEEMEIETRLFREMREKENDNRYKRMCKI